jgi:hypothetical protein
MVPSATITLPLAGTATVPWLVSTATIRPPWTWRRLTWQSGTAMSRLRASLLLASAWAERAAFISRGMLLNLLNGKNPGRVWPWTASGASS